MLKPLPSKAFRAIPLCHIEELSQECVLYKYNGMQVTVREICEEGVDVMIVVVYSQSPRPKGRSLESKDNELG